MGRRVGSQAEVTRRRDQWCAEVMQPNPIDQNARGQWVILAADGLRQLEPPAALAKRCSVRSSNQLEKLTWGLRSTIVGIPANEHAYIAGIGPIHQCRGARRRA